MILKLLKAVKEPRKAFSYLVQRTAFVYKKKKGVLLYLGLHKGASFNLLFREYESCYGFEANPEIFKDLQKRFGKYPNVHLFNMAVAQYDGEIEFNISNNNGSSSSIGNFNENWGNYKSSQIKMIKTISVPCVNIASFCKKHNIDFIDTYVSDIQGMDFEVLKTMKPMIDERRIDTIICEVARNDKGNVYCDLPDNMEKEFEELLRDNYRLVAKGWGVLKDGQFEEIPDGAWEMDCKWRLKRS